MIAGLSPGDVQGRRGFVEHLEMPMGCSCLLLGLLIYLGQGLCEASPFPVLSGVERLLAAF